MPSHKKRGGAPSKPALSRALLELATSDSAVGMTGLLRTASYPGHTVPAAAAAPPAPTAAAQNGRKRRGGGTVDYSQLSGKKSNIAADALPGPLHEDELIVHYTSTISEGQRVETRANGGKNWYLAQVAEVDESAKPGPKALIRYADGRGGWVRPEWILLRQQRLRLREEEWRILKARGRLPPPPPPPELAAAAPSANGFHQHHVVDTTTTPQAAAASFTDLHLKPADRTRKKLAPKPKGGSGAAAAAGAKTPAADASKLESRRQRQRLAPRVVVVGAGFAGISAARSLTDLGYSVVVLEARGRIGGRVHSFKTDGGVTLELGAAVLMGLQGGNPLATLCRKHGLAMHKLQHACPLHDADGAL